ncbi:hypothetical protein BGZ61DRAFT_229682 [Ilyonectria robusta]|uniref:uncharacterized protein n=1 Tax=Ilyonectria robusta TaxID=1079257 RepID=UPI001E8D6B5F|nr:uncharacterized protein BGZ61DRAFT_229682 [Ilyonectria robusta]KAH8651719.1 hypothetical protein BGZ61DRAFT_229682 [Ilyonectria robusta]
MRIRQPCRPLGHAPQCEAPSVIIRHPHYPDHESTLLRFPRLDMVTKHDQADSDFEYGIHHGTALSACQIVAGNAVGAYLSRDRCGRQRVEMSHDGILTLRYYYLHVRQGVDGVSPFAIVSGFEDWQFPSGSLPETWLCVNDVPTEASLPANGCIVSGNMKGEPALLVPEALSSWFCRNRMSDYLANSGGDFGPSNSANTCHLRADLLGDFDRRAFAFLPKNTSHGYRLVAHYLSAADDLFVPAHVFHNRMIHPPGRATLEFLYARFAYAVFGLVQSSTQTARRVAIVESGLDEFGLCTWVTNVYSMTPTKIAARRTELANQSLKKRSLEESRVDEDRYGPRLRQQSPTAHERLPQPSSRPEHVLSTWHLPPNPRRPGPLTFADLPAEVRLMIWEATWPEPRVIEIRAHSPFNPKTGYIEDYMRFQLYDTISNWLGEDDEADDEAGDGADDGADEEADEEADVELDHDSDHDSDDGSDPELEIEGRTPDNPRDVFGQLSGQNRHPVALSVCTESRIHTLKSFYQLRHHERTEWSFYFSPTRDVLWVPDSLWWKFDDEDAITLSRSYGNQLTQVKQLVLSMEKWRDIGELNVLLVLRGIETIHIRLSDDATSTEISTLLEEIELDFGNDDKYCSRFQLVDGTYEVRGQIQVGRHRK